MRSSILLLAAGFLSQALAGNYTLKKDYFNTTDFYGQFDFFTKSDPTHGFVKYIDQDAAKQNKMINFTSGKNPSAVIGVMVQNNTTPNFTDPDKDGVYSVRLTSKDVYDKMLVVININEAPIACGSWPAFWTLGNGQWPDTGEIDIFEGVNNLRTNQITLHTTAGCSAKYNNGVSYLNPANDTTKPVATCEGNNGCGFQDTSDWSYGQVGSGLDGFFGQKSNRQPVTYAMEWTDDGISVWWWGALQQKPDDLTTSDPKVQPDPSKWGQPAMYVDKSTCDIGKHFVHHNIIINTSFCGDWAGAQAVWQNSGCASAKYQTCAQYAGDTKNNYGSIKWNIGALKVFTRD